MNLGDVEEREEKPDHGECSVANTKRDKVKKGPVWGIHTNQPWPRISSYAGLQTALILLNNQP